MTLPLFVFVICMVDGLVVIVVTALGVVLELVVGTLVGWGLKGHKTWSGQ